LPVRTGGIDVAGNGRFALVMPGSCLPARL
jgi:hypothetical protein